MRRNLIIDKEFLKKYKKFSVTLESSVLKVKEAGEEATGRAI